MSTNGNGKSSMSVQESFVLAAISALRTKRSKGIHLVYSGFNAAFERRFSVKSRETVDGMVTVGMVVVQPCKGGGAMLYLASESPLISRAATNAKRADETLAKIDASRHKSR